MPKPQPELGAAELDVLKVLWDHGPGTVRDVMDHLHARGKKIAYTTVLTMLSRLEQKGAVAADKSEQAYVYRARVSRERVTATRLKALVQQLYDGAATPLVLHLMQSEKFTPEEIAQLQQLIDRLDAKD
jgi:predicted transcriptional regulator